MSTKGAGEWIHSLVSSQFVREACQNWGDQHTMQKLNFPSRRSSEPRGLPSQVEGEFTSTSQCLSLTPKAYSTTLRWHFSVSYYFISSTEGLPVAHQGMSILFSLTWDTVQPRGYWQVQSFKQLSGKSRSKAFLKIIMDVFSYMVFDVVQFYTSESMCHHLLPRGQPVFKIFIFITKNQSIPYSFHFFKSSLRFSFVFLMMICVFVSCDDLTSSYLLTFLSEVT